MSDNAVATPVRHDKEGVRWQTSSWLMLPLCVPSFAMGFVLAAVLLGAVGLEGSEPMSEQGAMGWLVMALSLVVVPLPSYLGVRFGLKARRLGQGAAAVAAAVLNALVILAFWALIIGTTLNQL